jgi:hypothetical protein
MRNQKKARSKKLKSKRIKEKDKSRSGWRATRWWHMSTDDNFIRFTFPKRGGGIGTVELTADKAESEDLVRKQLIRKGAAFSKDPANAQARLESLMRSIPDEPKIIVDRTGWHFEREAFVLADRVFGEYPREIRLSPRCAGKASSIGSAGNLSSWQESVGAIALHSSYISFGIMAALAAPMLLTSGFAEGMIFCFSGGSGQGKTTASRAAATVSGKMDALPDWNTTKRNLEELASSHSDVLLVVDDIEKSADSDSEIIQMINKLSHGLTSGQSKGYANVVSGPGRLEKLEWRCVGLTSSPIPIEDQIAAKKGKTARTDGQRVRLIDLPLPEDDNGIFNLLEGDKLAMEAQRNQLVGTLERAMPENYGTLLPAWIEILREVSTETITKHVETFVGKMVPQGSGFDRRFAMRFGLVYAAGQIAVRRQLLPWPKLAAREAVIFCYRQALTAMRGIDRLADEGQQKLGTVSKSPKFFPFLRRGGTIKAAKRKIWLGFRGDRNGGRILAIKRSGFIELVGSEPAVEVLVQHFDDCGVLAKGHGGKKGKQMPVRFEGDPKPQRPRFLVLDYKKAKQAFRW